jgi:hypothetical protein
MSMSSAKYSCPPKRPASLFAKLDLPLLGTPRMRISVLLGIVTPVTIHIGKTVP